MFIEKRLELIEEQLSRIECLLTGKPVKQNVFAVDIKEASKLIGVGMTNTRKMYKQGILKGHHEGKKIMISMKSIEDFIEWQASR